MFAKLGALALCASLVSALSLKVPVDIDVGGIVDVKLLLDVGDPVIVDLELIVAGIPVDVIAGVDLGGHGSDYGYGYHLPEKAGPRDGYTIQAVNPKDHKQVYGKSNPFKVKSKESKEKSY